MFRNNNNNFRNSIIIDSIQSFYFPFIRAFIYGYLSFYNLFNLSLFNVISQFILHLSLNNYLKGDKLYNYKYNVYKCNNSK